MPGLLHQKTYYVTEMYEKVIPYLVDRLDADYKDYFGELQIQADAKHEAAWDLKKCDKFYRLRNRMQPLSLRQIMDQMGSSNRPSELPVVEEMSSSDEAETVQESKAPRRCAICKESGHNKRKCPTVKTI